MYRAGLTVAVHEVTTHGLASGWLRLAPRIELCPFGELGSTAMEMIGAWEEMLVMVRFCPTGSNTWAANGCVSI